MELSDIKYTVQGIVKKTERAIDNSKHIPKRFLSEHMHELVELVKKIEQADEKPSQDEYLKVLVYCNEVKTSMEALSLRFDAKHLRLIYETEGVADF